MPQAAATAPIPIRLAYRYPNGCMLSYSARAIARDENSVRVIVNEEFDEGITLSLMAPFLEGLTTTWVHSVKRSRKNPGYFEVLLRIGADGASGPGSGGKGEGLTALENASAEDGGPRASQVLRAKPKNAVAVPEQAVEAAEKLAYELSKLPPRNLSNVIQEIPSGMRSLSLLVAIAAALHLLQEKKFVDASRLIASIKTAARETVSK